MAVKAARAAAVRHAQRMDLAVTAAFTAAALSLINVGVSARLTRASRLEEWRRDTERPIIARLLTLSRDAALAWSEANDHRIEYVERYTDGADSTALDRAGAAWRRGNSLIDRLNFETAQLDLIAGDRLRERARALLGPHESLAHWTRPASGADPHPELGQEEYGKLSQLADQLIAAARADIGVDRRRPTLGEKWRRNTPQV